MKLFLAPISLRVGCGQISNCLLALDKHQTGETTETCTHNNPTLHFYMSDSSNMYSSPRSLEILKLVFHSSDTTNFQKNVPLQDSITTWLFTGISLSRTHGEDSVNTICLSLHIFFIISFCFSSLSFVSLLSLRYLCWRTIRGNCPEGLLHWSQATLLSCPRRADRSQGNPSQLQPWSCHCK